MPHISEEFYRAGATILSPEAIQEIKDTRGRIPNAAKAMASKYHIHLVVSMTCGIIVNTTSHLAIVPQEQNQTKYF
ncbi:hypothetical protein RhiirA4_489378 [Rhizophagus irregularis]|uniref:Uncharacterized protein n=1 Tax=Rhizophagus irregularis TaxID=588596 RepID=A0A2I1HUQ9_9GLOM|nr:hypothetical protein RhiirA4_489378 [Rhizophagus irregularis]